MGKNKSCLDIEMERSGHALLTKPKVQPNMTKVEFYTSHCFTGHSLGGMRMNVPKKIAPLGFYPKMGVFGPQNWVRILPMGL